MAVTYEHVKRLKEELEEATRQRHEEHAKLRDFYHGRYWKNLDSQAHGIATIFRDYTSEKSDIGPDIKLVRNLVFDVCVKYQSFLSQLPMIKTFVDEPASRVRRAQAVLKERVLYGFWAEADMTQSMLQMGFYGPLMGDCFHGIWPDFDRKVFRSVIRSPEHAYPVTNFDGSKLDAVIFAWQVPENKAARMFPKYVPKTFRQAGTQQTGSETNPSVWIMEYSDGAEFARWVDDQKVNGIEHNLGFNLFEQVPFINTPGEVWNHGAVEQYVNLVEAGNAINSLLMQAMIENVFPRLILEDPLKFGEEIDTGAGATIGVNPGGKAYFLTPPTQTMQVASELLRENERAIKQGTSMPDVNFGQFNASIITGKAINELQGAGTGSLIEMVEGASHGPALVKWNEKALAMCRKYWPSEQIYLQGHRPMSMADLNPTGFALKFKGSQIVGSNRNEVIFAPAMDAHTKLVMNLQAMGGGLVSKKYSREQMAIPDSEAMQEEIVTEAIEDAVLATIVQALQNTADPASADQAEQTAVTYLGGGPAGPPHPLLAVPGGASPGGGPPAPLGGGGGGGGGMPVGQLPGGGGVAAPALNLPPGSPPPPGSQAAPPSGGAPPPSAAPSGGVTVQDATQAFSSVQLAGKAWLVGEIAAAGSTQDAVEIAVTDPADKQPLQAAATFPVVFHTVAGEPQEESVPIGGSG